MAILEPRTLDEKRHLLEWARARLPYCDQPFDPALCYPLGVVRGNALAAVLVYHQWRGCTIEESMAADDPRWATRQVVTYLLAWPFVQLGVRRITAIIAKRNKRSRRVTEGLGFVYEGKLEHAYPDDDAIIYGLTRARWQSSRWAAPIGNHSGDFQGLRGETMGSDAARGRERRAA